MTLRYAKAWAISYGQDFVVVRTRGRCLLPYEPMHRSEAIDFERQGFGEIAWPPHMTRRARKNVAAVCLKPSGAITD
jgi:hypothetical protein